MYYKRTLLILCIWYCVNCATSDKFDKTPDGNNRVEKNHTDSFDDKKHTFLQDTHNKSLTTIAEGVKIPSDELLTNLKGKLPVERNAQPSIVPRKGVKSSISARKGVEPPSEAEILNATKPEVFNNLSSTVKTVHDTDLTRAKNTTKAKTEKSKFGKKFKPKPTVTVAGAGDIPRPNLGVPTKTPPLGMSSKINYVVPVIVTILVLPLFVVFVIFLYRNGRECWDKRHYRRMDFLIDGMYNE